MTRSFRLAFVVIALALFTFSAFPLAENPPGRRLSDLTPGVRYDAGPYIAPVGCINRRWREGDYMPKACARGQAIDGAMVGLQEDQWMRYQPHEPRRYRWMRAGLDVVLAHCPLTAPCRIYQVVRDRFAPRPQDSPTIEGAPPPAFRTPPRAYRLARHVHALVLLPFGMFMLIAGLLPDRLLARKG